MATSEPLVPKGLPQGSRQAIRDARLQAGLPLDVPQNGANPQLSQGASSTPASPAPEGPLGLLLNNSPDAFPFLGQDTPQGQPTPTTSPQESLALSAQSSFARAVSARLAQNP